MTERSSFLTGEPCWADVTVPDPEAARRFYSAVFGWEFMISGPEFGDYTVCTVGGRPVAGIMPTPPGQAVAPMWSLYLAAPDVDDTAQRITKTGGQVLAGPMEIPGSGRMAYVADPAGAAFGLWQAGGHLGFGLVGETGAYAWSELNTRAPAVVDGFHRERFAYGQRQIGDGDTFDYSVWSLDGTEVCGRLAMTPEWGDTPTHWAVYYAVDSAEATCEQITRAGGTVLRPPFGSPYGRIAGVTDPAGASFNIVALAERTDPAAG